MNVTVIDINSYRTLKFLIFIKKRFPLPAGNDTTTPASQKRPTKTLMVIIATFIYPCLHLLFTQTL